MKLFLTSTEFGDNSYMFVTQVREDGMEKVLPILGCDTVDFTYREWYDPKEEGCPIISKCKDTKEVTEEELFLEIL